MQRKAGGPVQHSLRAIAVENACVDEPTGRLGNGILTLIMLVQPLAHGHSGHWCWAEVHLPKAHTIVDSGATLRWRNMGTQRHPSWSRLRVYTVDFLFGTRPLYRPTAQLASSEYYCHALVELLIYKNREGATTCRWRRRRRLHRALLRRWLPSWRLEQAIQL